MLNVKYFAQGVLILSLHRKKTLINKIYDIETNKMSIIATNHQYQQHDMRLEINKSLH